MPLTHQTVFPVRYYECDAYGHLNNAVYLRYMQEAAFNASAALGYDTQRYAQLGRAWLARLTNIEYLLPVTYGDRIEVTTWVEDMRRVRSLRAYEFHRQGTNEMVARAWTDWVYVDSKTSQPVSIPPQIAGAYQPGGNPAMLAAHRGFSEPPPPPPGVFLDHRMVEWRDLDAYQHVNNAMYLDYLVEAGWRFGLSVDWSWERVQAVGFGVVARRTQIEYLQGASYSDELEIATWLSDVRRSTVVRHFTIQRPRDGAVLARANSLYAFIDLATNTVRRIPQVFLDGIAANITPSGEPRSAAR